MSAKLKLNTTRFGELEVDPETLIDLPAGLIGFPAAKKFVLLEYTPPFSWLQCVELPDLAFVVVSAAEFGEEYSFELPFQDRAVDLNETDDVAIFNLVTIRPDASLSTVNLKAPVVVNLRNRKGRQVILDDPRYPTRMPLYGAAEEKTEEKPKE